MEELTPPPCPNTVTVRRNPHRKARATPSTRVPLPSPFSPPSSLSKPHDTQEILHTDPPVSKNLKVFLRIRPLTSINRSEKRKNGALPTKTGIKNAWPRKVISKAEPKEMTKKKNEICISANDSHSVTLSPPSALQDVRRSKSEVYEGFSYVFCADSTQDEVFEKMVNPLVDDFLRGKSGMLAAMGPSGSGKTHTIFGSPREPGMVPLALRRIFSIADAKKSQVSRMFYLSMFEIYSERGKAERLLDLSQDGGDLSMQQSIIKGLKEVVICDVQQAESLIACGMLKRATAMTNSNSQSSRSQCIINIRSAANKSGKEIDVQPNCVVLTIVDLAGAEREKRTGNQGARLLESNFINNTSMVFGLCLRSLLEHQKNPKKPLHKHFQSSLLTRYLRDYLEGKRRMALILTVKSGEEDYLDTSFLLRQASPYMKIKFDNVEESANFICTKRHIQTHARTEQLKRIKFSSVEACPNNGEKGAGDENQLLREEGPPSNIKKVEPQNCLFHHARKKNSEVNGGKWLKEDTGEWAKKERENKIMQNFAKALWNVLKQYKEKVKVAENQIQGLRESLANEISGRSALETEVKELKAYILSQKAASLKKMEDSTADMTSDGEVSQCTFVSKLNAGVPSLCLDESECIVSKEKFDNTVNNFGANTASCLAVENFEQQQCQDLEGLSINLNKKEDSRYLENVGDDTPFNNDATDSCPASSVLSSPKSLIITTIDSRLVEGDELHTEEDKEILHPPTEGKEDAELGTGCTVAIERKSDINDSSLSKPLNVGKPKRRLLPASSMLLDDIGCKDFNDENEKAKGGRGEKVAAPDERNRTHGSLSLLHLLRSKSSSISQNQNQKPSYRRCQ
ncbi:kinesin-like protein KIN-6 [Diospyros lotus]|uniref:kinesin-like protein KIN-6 n=1 Tax=Diospyros lotus TaxID=55363 RepID=UPI00225BAF9E|nr:kinesin-like protein KIN-6 [Diospyros lotus]